MSKPKSKKQPQTNVSNCTFTSAPFVVNEQVAAAITALALAAQANAQAIERCAERLTGPSDNRIALNIGGK